MGEVEACDAKASLDELNQNLNIIACRTWGGEEGRWREEEEGGGGGNHIPEGNTNTIKLP